MNKVIPRGNLFDRYIINQPTLLTKEGTSLKAKPLLTNGGDKS